MDILTYRLKGMAKAIDARFDTVEARSLPAGGVVGQILSKTGADDYAFGWTPGITVGAAPPASPVVNQLWVDTN